MAFAESQVDADLPGKLREFVASQFSHGVPYAQAKAFGPEAVPILESLLVDESMNSYRSEILITIAFIGDERGFEILRSFVVDTFKGPVDIRTFQAATLAQTAIGFVRSSKTVPYLVKGSNPATWRSLKWSYIHSGDDLAVTLSEKSILGLPYTGDPKARETLEQLEARPYSKKQLPSIKQALETFDAIRAVGLEEYQRSGGVVRRGVTTRKHPAGTTPEKSGD